MSRKLKILCLKTDVALCTHYEMLIVTCSSLAPWLGTPAYFGRALCVKRCLRNVEHTELIDALGSDVLKMDILVIQKLENRNINSLRALM